MQRVRKISGVLFFGAMLLGVTLSRSAGITAAGPDYDVDVLVVGAGISGLSCALEIARNSAAVSVRVVDMNSVFGGHAVMAGGGVCIVGTPMQERKKIQDSPELAYKDFVTWGEDPDPRWTRYYVNNSRRDIYDWVVPMGVVFDDVQAPYGNSVPRFHQTRGGGLALVTAIYKQCLGKSNISYKWNFKVESLVSRNGRVAGVKGLDSRTGAQQEIKARVVVLATGGFQSNLEIVRESWPKPLRFPERLLIGAGVNAVGSGHKIAKSAGGVLTRLDHQWNYITGLPDPLDPTGTRGINAYDEDSIWVNSQGKRFIKELASAKEGMVALLEQKPATYWAIFDDEGKHKFKVTVAGWRDFSRIENLILNNPKLTGTASTIEGLAAAAGLPPAALAETVRRYNEMVDAGEDTEFGAFTKKDEERPAKIVTPPFFAVQFFPVTRKSMGGVLVDMNCRVIDKKRRAIPGLYAVGELTGFGGINGKAGLEGTFLGPSIVTGRIAGRTALAQLNKRPHGTIKFPWRAMDSTGGLEYRRDCSACHNLESLLAARRNGYWHFEKVHSQVVERKYDCAKCHAEMVSSRTHRIDRMAQMQNCILCHQR